MAKIGRNAPCSCGSGKKYKQCCLSADEKAHRDSLPKVVSKPRPRPHFLGGDNGDDGDAYDYEELDRLSNRVPQLLNEGRVDEAEKVCHELMSRFPEVADGIERLGHVHEVRGDVANAVAHYRRAAAFIRETEVQEDEHALWLDQLADRIEQGQST